MTSSFGTMIGPNIALTLIAGAGLGWLIWRFPPAVWTGMQSVGLCILIFGFALWTTARFQLGKSLTVTAQAKQLVNRGLYSKIRNPIYVFGSWVIAGLILLVGRPRVLLVFLVLIPLQLWRAHKEARVLEEKFGEEYRSYRARTWF
jgi:protein-S-isoprenylcysteine O-methyltransferase Ste14